MPISETYNCDCLEYMKTLPDKFFDLAVVDPPCCATCRNKMPLTKFDYSKGGCEHTKLEGFACLAFEAEREIVWMVGINENADKCECYLPASYQQVKLKKEK